MMASLRALSSRLALAFLFCAFCAACQSRQIRAVVAASPTAKTSPSPQAPLRLAPVVAPPPAAIKAALAAVNAADDAWNRGDAAAFLKNYSPAAQWTYPAAAPSKLQPPNKVVLQRKQLEQTLAAPGFRFSPYNTTQTWVSFPSANVAEVHSIIEFVNRKPAGPYLNGPVVRTLNNVNGTWTIIHDISGANLAGSVDICGNIGESCCAGWVYGGSGIPQKITTCASGAACSGGVCIAGPTPAPCGGLGQDCCPDPDNNDNAYDFCTSVSDTVCYTWQGPHGTCQPCGAQGQGVCASNHCARPARSHVAASASPAAAPDSPAAAVAAPAAASAPPRRAIPALDAARRVTRRAPAALPVPATSISIFKTASRSAPSIVATRRANPVRPGPTNVAARASF
jgi:hypothetical protein